MTNVRASDRQPDPERKGFLLRSLLGFVAICAILLAATHALMDNIIRSSIGEHAAVTAEGFIESALREVPDFGRRAGDGEQPDWQLDALVGRLRLSTLSDLKLFDDAGRRLFQVSSTGFVEIGGGAVNEIARETAASGERRHMSVETHDIDHPHAVHHTEEHDHVFVETFVPVAFSDGRVYVVDAHVDVTDLSSSLEARLNLFSLIFVVGGLLAYSIPALILALRTRELRRRDLALVKVSRRDGLTGLLNRGSAAEQFVTLLPREGGERVTLFYLDLDRFKSINDTIGHAGGDRLLEHVGQALSRLVGPEDVAARFGGDEFVVVRRHPEGESDEDFAQAILAEVSAPLEVFGQHVRPGISVGGFALTPETTFDDALRAADVALYEAKSHGRGRYVRHTGALVARRERRNTVEKRIRAAIATDDFYLEYQPIYCGRVERLMGFEALLRLTDTSGTPIPPVEFIPVAESAGLIEELGQIALRRALAVAGTWPEDIFIAVNVSALQFGSGDFPALVERELIRSGVSPARLELELTESVFLDDDNAVDIEIAELKSLGVSLALDDFGTGYSSLAYLWRLPFDKVKIDRAFLEGFEFDREKYVQFISTVVLLGRQMGMKVTAEGLETTDQLAMLETMGVNGYQGYLLGRPLPEPVATDYAHRRPPPALMVLDEVDPPGWTPQRSAG